MILNTKPLKDVEYGFVTLAGGVYTARITTAVKPNKDGTGKNLEVYNQILDPEVVNSEGKKVVNRGNIKLTRWIALQAKEGSSYDPDASIKELGVAAGINCDAGEDVTTERLDGAIVKVKLALRGPEGQYSERNEVKSYSPADNQDRAIAANAPF